MTEVTSSVYLNSGIGVRDFNECILCEQNGKVLFKQLKDRLFGAPGVWNIFECSNCSLMWINPMPIADEIPKLYATYYTHNTKNRKHLYSFRKFVKQTILSNEFGYVTENKKNNSALGKVITKIGPLVEIIGGTIMWLNGGSPGRVLDIGCGNGKFLYNMKKLGWETFGIEPDEEAVRIAKEHYGLQVMQGTLENVFLPENNFNAITMNHVIEHIANPIQLLKSCYDLLKPGGKIVILTPNAYSLGRKIFQKSWRGWEVPRHLFIFSPYSLGQVIKKANFKIKTLKTISKSSRHIWYESRMLMKNTNSLISKSIRLESYLFWITEYLLCKRYKEIGEEILLIAEK